ncbi:MAG: hypothetical protein H6734_12520 [Alphaproteobacteria bacterium]|nr:hypothetical protein [Alphaproteobacteria bacterium]
MKNWFVVQVYISMDGSTPPTPPQHPYASVDLLEAWVPTPLPPRRAIGVPEEPAP